MNRRAFLGRLLAVPAALTALYTAAAHNAHAITAFRRIKVVANPYLTDNEAWFLTDSCPRTDYLLVLDE